MWVSIGSGEGKGLSVRVEGERFVVGSGSECQLMVGDPRVAPLHAYFEVEHDGRVLLHDLGSEAEPQAPVRVRTDEGRTIEVVPDEGEGDAGPRLLVTSDVGAVEVVPAG